MEVFFSETLLDSVTVHLNGAIVSRTFSVQYKQDTQADIIGFPARYNPNSLNIQPLDQETVITAVTKYKKFVAVSKFYQIYYSDLWDEIAEALKNIRKLKVEIEEAESTINNLNRELDVLRLFLDSHVKSKADTKQLKVPDMVDFILRKDKLLEAQIQKKKTSVQSNKEKEYALFRKILATFSGIAKKTLSIGDNSNKDKWFKNVDSFIEFWQTELVEIQCAKIKFIANSRETNFLMTYQVFDTYWVPKYEIHTDLDDTTDASVMTWRCLGSIHQNSGETWFSNTSLYLSTDNLSNNCGIPSFPRSEINFVEPENAKSKACDYNGEPLRLRMCKDAVDGPTDNLVSKENKTDSILAIKYLIKLHPPIHSNENVNDLIITTLNLPIIRLIRYGAPQVSKSVFVLAQAINNTEFSLLSSSNIQVFINRSYVGTSKLSRNVFKEDTFLISLTTDPRITILPLTGTKLGDETTNQVLKEKIYESNCIIHASSDKIKKNILIAHPLPLSTQKTIGVQLIEPSFYQNIFCNDHNDSIIEAFDLLKSTSEHNFVNLSKQVLQIVPITSLKTPASIKYKINWPADKKIDFHEVED